MTLITIDFVASKIHFVREEKVILDSDIAALYGAENKVLKQAVRRNLKRFSKDFMFELTPAEWSALRSQIVTLEKGRVKYSKYPPFAFTEQDVAMLLGVIRSKKVIEVNIAIMRTFVAFRKLRQSNGQLAAKIRELEKKYDHQFQVVFEAIQRLIVQETNRRPIGFKI